MRSQPSGFHPWRWAEPLVRRKDTALRTVTFLTFTGAGAGRTLPYSPAGVARNRLGFQFAIVRSALLPRQLRST